MYAFVHRTRCYDGSGLHILNDESFSNLIRTQINHIFDIDNLDAKGHTFELEQVAFWDEIHIYQIAGCHKDKTLVFARNEDGIYDDDGDIPDVKKVRNDN